MPFDTDETINEKILRDLVEFLIRAGVDALFVNGGTGEGIKQTAEERKFVGETVINQVKERVAVVIHVGDCPRRSGWWIFLHCPAAIFVSLHYQPWPTDRSPESQLHCRRFCEGITWPNRSWRSSVKQLADTFFLSSSDNPHTKHRYLPDTANKALLCGDSFTSACLSGDRSALVLLLRES